MDLETFVDGGKLYPYCVCLRLNEVDHSLWYSDSLVNDLLGCIAHNARSSRVEVYTHNINFDGLILLDFIKISGLVFDMYVRDHNIYWLKVVYLRVEIVFRCSYKILSSSVANLGRMIGYPKTVFPYSFVNRYNLEYVGPVPDPTYFNSLEDYNSFSSEHSVFDLRRVSITYCMRDVMIVYTVLKNIVPIVHGYAGGAEILKKSFSFSSLSYKLFSRLYDVYGVTKGCHPIEQQNYIRGAYYGGRCEVFGNPNDGDIVHYYDFPGMYGMCMMEKFPVGVPRMSRVDLSLNKVGFHTIKFKVDTYLPFLPFRSDKLLFPNGTMVGTF